MIRRDEVYKIGKLGKPHGVKVAEVGSMADAEYILAPGVYVCNGKKYVIK